VALNLCYDRQRRRREWTTDELPEVVDEAALPDAVPGDDERRVQQALQRIAPRQREAIVLVYYQDLSNIEAASAMQVSVDALESLLARGRRSMQAMLIGDDGDD